MPEVTPAEKGGHNRHMIKAQPGEHFMLCRCYASKEFPFCDGAHRNLPHNLGPVIIDIEKAEKEEPAAEN